MRIGSSSQAFTDFGVLELSRPSYSLPGRFQVGSAPILQLKFVMAQHIASALYKKVRILDLA
eukprot:SAG11_NODE_2121_length_3790_cov_3.824709_1_plen_62_part_00